ncbi:HD-GYP domain-containing protein [Thermotoga caldifontis]|uniref:HD-GYP domain-containing protein n=1 Tax=Thermotoga caldifontis TaxID=1508419 RepID=UPI000596B136|nr:HD-GYP domain-containing protein [Thermotoga caldifontis]
MVCRILKEKDALSERFERLCLAEEPTSTLFITDSLKEGLSPQLVVKKESVELYDAGKLVARFVNEPGSYDSIWAFVKSYVDREDSKASLTSYRLARRVISGILQAMVVLMETEDKEGFSHSQRVARLCLEMAEELGLDEKQKTLLKECAMLHDVGKIGIEQLMMYTPTRIRIFENMPQDHTVMGAVYLSSIEYLWDVVPAVRSHHERWDGKGYPDGLRGEEIPLFARIIAICDYFDELTHFVTSEWGTGPKTEVEALEMVKNQSGKMFDPELVEVFVRVMEKKLSGGRVEE